MDATTTATSIAPSAMAKAAVPKSSKPGSGKFVAVGGANSAVASGLAETLDRNFEDHMERCQAAWKAGVSLAIGEAVSWCHVYGHPLPGWLVAAILHAVNARRSKAEIKRHLEDLAHYTRWDAVNELRERKAEFSERGDDRAATWDRRWAAVADLLGNCEPETVRQSYMKVNNDMKKGRAARYFIGTAHLFHPPDLRPKADRRRRPRGTR